MKQPGGTTLNAIAEATQRQAHSVHGFISGTLSKKMGLTVVSAPTPPPNRTFVFELVDYAYQDTPNVPIRAGEGIPQADASLPASLGLLAYGSDAIPAWRTGGR